MEGEWLAAAERLLPGILPSKDYIARTAAGALGRASPAASARRRVVLFVMPLLTGIARDAAIADIGEIIDLTGAEGAAAVFSGIAVYGRAAVSSCPAFVGDPFLTGSGSSLAAT